jgi:hypothetical protein
MAKKKEVDPMATALTIAGIAAAGWAVWKYVISPYRNKLKQSSMGVDSPMNYEILDAQFEIIDNGQQA